MPYLAKGLEENAQVLVLCDLVWQVHDVQARQGFLLQPRLLSRLSSNRNPSALQDQRRPDTTCSSISFARLDPSRSPAAPVLLGLGKHHDNRGTAQPLAVDAKGSDDCFRGFELAVGNAFGAASDAVFNQLA